MTFNEFRYFMHLVEQQQQPEILKALIQSTAAATGADLAELHHIIKEVKAGII